MVFSSTVFLTAFLPLFLWLYVLAPRFLKNPLLLVASLIFYSWGAPRFLFVVLGLTTATYFQVALMDRARTPFVRRLLLTITIIQNVGLLFYFKYLTFFVGNFDLLLKQAGISASFAMARVVLPIGISFYTFETVTYAVDVYRRVHRPLDRLWLYQLYILMFPKLIAGPIVRFHEIADQFSDRFSRESATDRLVGMHRFCLGLGKKVLIANALAAVVDAIYGDSNTGAGGIDPKYVEISTAWLAAIAYSLQIYFDFSGYSDMAIGLGRFMGFRFPENFNCPYISSSITEFWRRWHMTLGAWMRDYLYIPLGGNRVHPVRMYFNLWIVFLISGLWHGASWNFVLWGAWHGLFLVGERFLNLHGKAVVGRPFRMGLTFVIVLFGWVYFRVEDLNKATQYALAMLGQGSGSQTWEISADAAAALMAAAFFSVACVNTRLDRLRIWIYEDAVATWSGRLFMTVSSASLFTLSLCQLAAAEFNPFIYFRF